MNGKLYHEALTRMQRRLAEILLERGRYMPPYIQNNIVEAVKKLTSRDFHELVQIYKRYMRAEGEE